MQAAVFAFALVPLGACIASEPPRAYRQTWKEALDARPPATRGAASRATLEPASVTVGSGPLELSVEQALLLALRRNRSLVVEQLQAEITGAYELIERGVYDPELFARANHARGVATETTNVTGERFSVRSDGDAFEAGIRQRLPTGTALEISALHDRSASSRRPEQYEARVGMTVTQALLQGFGPAVGLAAVRVAEADTLASVWELRAFTEALLAEAERTYWRHVLAQESVGIVERSLAVTERQLSEIEQFIAVGKLAPFDAAALRAEVAQRNQDLIDAKSAVELERFRMLRIMGLREKPGEPRPLIAASEPRITPEALSDLDERFALALRLRGDLNEARMRIEREELQAVVTRNGLLPRLDLFITLGKSGYADSFGGSLEDIDGDAYDFGAGLELSYALGNRSGRGRAAADRLEKRQAEAAVKNLEELIELDVRAAAIELERARQQIIASAATRTFREASATAESARLRVGAGTALDLAQAQRDLVESELAELRAMIEYRQALVELYRAEGSLLERRGLSVTR
jgi:outer membrane protein